MKIVEIAATMQMAYFEATVHQIRFRLGLPGPLAGFQVPASEAKRAGGERT